VSFYFKLTSLAILSSVLVFVTAIFGDTHGVLAVLGRCLDITLILRILQLNWNTPQDSRAGKAHQIYSQL
jgi:hypothetical protein